MISDRVNGTRLYLVYALLSKSLPLNHVLSGPGQDRHSSHIFHWVDVEVTYDDAVTECQGLGMRLAVLDKQEKKDKFQTYMDKDVELVHLRLEAKW